jgi:hypothetical protein
VGAGHRGRLAGTREDADEQLVDYEALATASTRETPVASGCELMLSDPDESRAVPDWL